MWICHHSKCISKYRKSVSAKTEWFKSSRHKPTLTMSVTEYFDDRLAVDKESHSHLVANKLALKQKCWMHVAFAKWPTTPPCYRPQPQTDRMQWGSRAGQRLWSRSELHCWSAPELHAPAYYGKRALEFKDVHTSDTKDAMSRGAFEIEMLKNVWN